MAQDNSLSSREWEVVKLLQEGKSNKLIAAALGISERTVEFHLKNIYAKYQVSSRIELVLKLGESTVSAKPVDSTVASEDEVVENRDMPSSRNWATSLKEAVSKIGKEFKMENSMNVNARSDGKMMSFFESIRVCLQKFADFEGRASRPEFWWFALAVTLITAALTYISTNAATVFLILVLLPLFAAGTRRLHDSGHSAWWQLFVLAPIAGIVVVGFMWAKPSIPPQD